MSEQQFPKRCAKCGTVHTAESWAELRCIGEQAYAGETLEFRNCACGSTLTIVVAVELAS